MSMFRRRFTYAATAGFTLVELLVVIAIIGLLSAIVLASLNTARAKGRDARRVSDIKQIQLALTLYYDSNAAFPTSLGSGATSPLVTNGFISSLPTDPTSGTAYSYVAYASGSDTTVCNSYHIGATLESGGSTALSNDADVTTLTPVTGNETASPDAMCTASGNGTDFHGSDSSPCNAADTFGSACFDETP